MVVALHAECVTGNKDNDNQKAKLEAAPQTMDWFK